MNMKLTLIFVALSFSALAGTEKSRAVVFQADKNGAQVLPQKFEYTLLDAEKIRIGDILIDSSTFNFQLIRSGSSEKYRIKFNWPAAMLTQGQLILMNNNGKALWKNTITEKQIKITPMKSEFAPLRAELAEFTSDIIETEVLNTMKYLPFINFCISTSSDNTKIYLCSRELYILSAEKEIVVKDRLSPEKKASVEINGKAVGPQGIIVLNDINKNILFRSTAESGAYLEIETRRKEVDFKDLVLSENGETLILTASGTEPADSSKVKILGENLWQIQIPANRPIIYLKGGGGIPMRQEFFIKGDVPKESLRPQLAGAIPDKTFSSSITLQGTIPPGTRLRAMNTKDAVRGRGKNSFTWELRDLSHGISSSHYINIFVDSKNYVARYDIYRGCPYVLQAGIQYQSPSGVAIGDLKFQWWLEKFINDFKWGVELDENIHLTNKIGFPQYDETRLELLYRFNPGLPMQESVWGLGLPVVSIKGQDTASTAFGLTLWGFQASPDFFPSWIQWYQPKLTYLMANGADTNFKLLNWIEFETLFYTPLAQKNWLTYGPHYRMLTWDPVPTAPTSQIVLDIGYLFNF